MSPDRQNLPEATPTPALVVCAHGTDDPQGRQTVLTIADRVRTSRPGLRVETAYVDVQEPSLDTVVERLVGEGYAVVVVPLLLSTGYHIQVDVARAVAGHRYAVAAPALGPAPELATALRDRLIEAGASPQSPVVLAAAGSSRAEAGEDVIRQVGHLRRAWDGPVEVGYLAGEPSLADVVGAHPEAFVASYLIGEGFFQSRLRRLAADSAGATEPLGAHSQLVAQVVRRFEEASPLLAAG